jgi:hypothetical protein
MGGWITGVEGVCTSSEEQTENRKDSEETHAAVEEFLAHKGTVQ